MAWVLLVTAGLFEIGWAVGLKFTQGFTRLWPTIGTVGAMVASMVLLGVAVRTLPLGTAYAVWTGIGTAGTAILAMFLFNEPVTLSRVVFLSMIVLGILGLKATH
jgi:quaternary ammonium compound-resistance protein SugE